MKSPVRFALSLLVVSSLFAFAGCGDDDDTSNQSAAGAAAHGGDAAGGANGSAKCEEIAQLCHPVDDGDGPLHECHEQSEVGNAAKCVEIYASCIAQCQAAHDAAAGGAGGGGSTPVGGAAAGGAETGVGGVAAGGVAAGGAATGGAGGAQ